MNLSKIVFGISMLAFLLGNPVFGSEKKAKYEENQENQDNSSQNKENQRPEYLYGVVKNASGIDQRIGYSNGYAFSMNMNEHGLRLFYSQAEPYKIDALIEKGDTLKIKIDGNDFYRGNLKFEIGVRPEDIISINKDSLNWD